MLYVNYMLLSQLYTIYVVCQLYLNKIIIF